MITLAQAEAQLRKLIEGDFSTEVVVTSPAGATATLRGQVNDIGHQIDPDTGLAFSGRQSTVALSISALQEAGFSDLPRGIADKGSKPWRVAFAMPTGSQRTFKVTETRPDKLGIVVCFLETYGESDS